MDGVMHATLSLGAVFTGWPPSSSTITTTAVVKQLASPLPSPTCSPSPQWWEHACFPRPLMMLSSTKLLRKKPTALNRARSSASINSMSLTAYFSPLWPRLLLCLLPACWFVLRAAVSSTLLRNSLSSMASCLLPESRQCQTVLFTEDKSTEISRLCLCWHISCEREVC